MNTRKLTGRAALLLLTLWPILARTAEIRQEEYNFQMELTHSATRKTFVIGEFPSPPTIRPPAAAPVRGNAGPALAIRVGNKETIRQVSSNSTAPPANRCFIPAVLFARDSAAISKQTENTLLAALDRCVPGDTPLVITGYTCDLGTREVNDIIARRRAEAVAALLRRHGLIVAEVRSEGESGPNPISPSKRYLARRVEIGPADELPARQRITP